MKQQLTIGRDESCNIIIADNSDVISRRHAILNIDSYGKMTITDVSTNGTYVNGMRIASNVPVPVTKNDTVSLAHVSQLDWSRVEAPNLVLKRVLLGIVMGVLLICGGFGITKLVGGCDPKIEPVVKDSAQVKKELVEPANTTEAKDSASKKTAANDSTVEKKDSVKTKTKQTPVAPKKEEPKEKKDTTKRPVRPIL